MTNTFDTTNRSDFTWPFLAERQRIFDWDRYEFKAEAEHPHFLEPQSFRNVETLKTIPYAQRLPFDFDCYPKPILCSQQPISHYPTEKVIEYDKDKAEARSNILRTRPRVFKCPQISLDDVSADRRDMVCTFVYSTSKTMSELTSGVPEGRPIPVDIPSKPFADPYYYATKPPLMDTSIADVFLETSYKFFTTEPFEYRTPPIDGQNICDQKCPLSIIHIIYSIIRWTFNL